MRTTAGTAKTIRPVWAESSEEQIGDLRWPIAATRDGQELLGHQMRAAFKSLR